jgi:HK97 family phage major capsid protein
VESLKELLAGRAKLIADARKILDTADADGKRQLSTDERGEYDRIDADIEKLSDQIEAKKTDETRAERHAKYDAMLAEAAGRQVPALRPGTPRGGDGAAALTFDFGRAGKLNTEEVGEQSGELVERLRERSSPGYQRLFRTYLRGERRGQNFEQLGLQISDDSRGGYSAPMAFLSMLIKFLDDAVQVRKYATVLPPTMAPSVGILSYDTDYADSTWTAEVPASDLAEDDTARFGRREMMPHLLSKLIKTSRKMLASPTFPIESFLAKRLAYKFGITENKGFLSGTGQQQPLGVFTADNAGIGTGQDVTCAATTVFTADECIDTVEKIKTTYQQNATWIVSRAFRQRARKLKSGTGEYLLVENNGGNNSGVLSTLVGRPLIVDENAPNTFTTGKYIAVFGDLSFYWIQDGIDLQIQRLDELLALRNQVGWIGRKETDGMPVLAEAFSRLKLG